VSIPSAPEFLLSLLRAAEGGQSAASLRARLAEGLVPPGLGVVPWPADAWRQFGTAVQQAAQALSAAGLLLASEDGLWCLTERGREALAQGLGPGKTSADAPGGMPSGGAAAPPPSSGGSKPQRYRGGNRPRAAVAEERRVLAGEPLPPAEAMRRAEAANVAALSETLLQRLREKPPAFLEAAVVRLLVAMGYGNALRVSEATPRGSGDGGIDGLVAQDALGLDRVAVQTKRNDAGLAVGAATVRDFYGALARAKAGKGVIATTAQFTREARETAALLPAPIVLIDGVELARLMIRHGVGCRVVTRHALAEIDEGFFAERCFGESCWAGEAGGREEAA